MEAVMIANPKHRYFQYNPYTKRMSIEQYDFEHMIQTRQAELARCTLTPDSVVGVIQGVLGRQGSTHITEVGAAQPAHRLLPSRAGWHAPGR